MTEPIITPMFFPFSHMRKDQLRCLTAFFSKISFLPLVPDFTLDEHLGGLTAQGVLHPLFPSTQDLDRVDQQVRSYQDWAQLHRGNEKNFKALLQEQPYFIDDTDLPRIQSQIRSGIQKKEAPTNTGEPKKKLSDPLLLLKFAEILDIQNEGIEDELIAVEQRNASLFSQLLGETSDTNLEKPDGEPFPSAPRDPGSTMTEERLVSWFKYAEKKGAFKGGESTAFLVTTSPVVLDYMVSKCEGVINGLDIDSIKVHENECENKCKWQENFFDFLEKIMGHKSSPEIAPPESDDICSLTGKIRVCLFPEDSTKAFLNIPGQSMAVCLVQLKS